jgi:DNA polymerase-3 subunit alpha
VLNKRTIESLVKAGAFDSLSHPRKGLLHNYEQIIDQTLARRREHDMGVLSLFGDVGSGPDFDERTPIPDLEFDKTTQLAFEKEMLGLYISDHPLFGHEAALGRHADITLDGFLDAEDGVFGTVGGVVTGLDKKWTRKGDLMATFELEDLTGSIEVMVFPRTMSEHGHKLEEDAVVLVTGRLDGREEVRKLICQEVEIFDIAKEPTARSVRLRVPSGKINQEIIGELKNLLIAHPGPSEVLLELSDRKVLRLSEEFSVEPANGLIGELRVLLGVDAVVFE